MQTDDTDTEVESGPESDVADEADAAIEVEPEPVTEPIVAEAPTPEATTPEPVEAPPAPAAPVHVSPPESNDEMPWTRPVRTERFGRIGTTLIERGLITNEQLDEALEIQRSSGRRVGDILVDLRALSAFELARVLADHMGVPFTDLNTKPPDPILATLLPEDVARRYDALAIARWNEQLVIAMANPTDLFALDDLQMVTRQPIIAAMAVKEDLRAAIDRVYRVSIVETTLDKATSDYTTETSDLANALVEVDEGPIVGLVNALLGQAVTDHASDLHIEPSSTHIAIRFRVDGVLHDSSTVPLELLRPLVSRVKILAGLDIANNRLAQDGRFSLTIERRPVDVRVVTMPTAAGESVILRLLDPIRDALGVPSLGLSEVERKRFIPAFFASQGAIFIAGPTGSGKTSTIYAVLSEVNTRSKAIVSIENPVEFRLDGIKQMQINPRVGLTFSTALPAVLRADPDIVFIGEVRDTDTARIAADASITGHLVLSTLHATSAGVGADAPDRDGRRALPRGLGAHARRVAAARAQALRALLGTGRGRGARAAGRARSHRGAPARGHGAARGRLPGLPRHRLPRPAADLRDHARDRGHRPLDPRPGGACRHRAPRRRGGHGHASHGCHAARGARRAQPRRDAPHHLLTRQLVTPSSTPVECFERRRRVRILRGAAPIATHHSNHRRSRLIQGIDLLSGRIDCLARIGRMAYGLVLLHGSNRASVGGPATQWLSPRAAHAATKLRPRAAATGSGGAPG